MGVLQRQQQGQVYRRHFQDREILPQTDHRRGTLLNWQQLCPEAPQKMEAEIRHTCILPAVPPFWIHRA